MAGTCVHPASTPAVAVGDVYRKDLPAQPCVPRELGAVHPRGRRGGHLPLRAAQAGGGKAEAS